MKQVMLRWGLILWLVFLTSLVPLAYAIHSADETDTATVKRICSQCHGLKAVDGIEITSPGQGLEPYPALKGMYFTATPRDWNSTVERMRTANQANMTPDEQASITAYLNINYGLQGMPGKEYIGARLNLGRSLVANKCTQCHEAYLIESAELDAEGWVDIIEYMESLGAEVADEEKEVMIEYLTATYGPKAPLQSSKEPSSRAEQPQKSGNKGVCGPTAIVLLALLPIMGLKSFLRLTK